MFIGGGLKTKSHVKATQIKDTKRLLSNVQTLASVQPLPLCTVLMTSDGQSVNREAALAIASQALKRMVPVVHIRIMWVTDTSSSGATVRVNFFLEC